MSERRGILLSSIGIMAVISLSAAAAAIYVLRQAHLEVCRDRLNEIVQNHAALIEAVAGSGESGNRQEIPEGATKAALSQVLKGHERFKGFGETGEFTLARREGDQIVWLLRHRHGGGDLPRPTPLSLGLAEPMRLALRGGAGVVEAPDYRGVEVLAAYAWIPDLEWGLVAKIDMAEINQPFRKAGVLVSAIAILLIASGVGFILRVTSPLLQRVEARSEELREIHDRFRVAASEETLAEDRERRRLAIDVHDGIGQLLTLTSMRLAMLRKSAEASGLVPQIREAEELVLEATERSRSLTFQLCPPVLFDVGLLEAARWLAGDMERCYGLHVKLENDGHREPLGEVVRISLFRGLRELLINVAKHAGTSEAIVRFSGNEQFITVAVEDRGVGLAPGADRGRYGLFSVRERMRLLGGSMQIESLPGHGTRVVLTSPIGSGESMESSQPA